MTPDAAPPVRFLELPGAGKVAYAVHGEGPLVVCPAWWVSHVERDWARATFRNFFTGLGQRLKVVRYDRPGVGLSDPLIGPRSLASELEVLARIVEELNAPRVSLLSISSASPPALAFAAERPEAVERMVFCGAYADGRMLAPGSVSDAMVELVRAHWGLGSRTLADLFIPDLSGAELEAFGAWQREACDGETAANLLHLTYEMNAAQYLSRVRAPTRVIHRIGDRAIPFAAGRALAAGIPGAELIPLDGRAHPPWEGNFDVAPLVAEFITLSEQPPQALLEDCRLDTENCELVVDGQRVALTRLELGLLRYLEARTGRVATRDELLQAVWQQAHVGSNVIESVVRSVRKKLGAYRSSIETVTGHGYRFRGYQRDLRS